MRVANVFGSLQSHDLLLRVKISVLMENQETVVCSTFLDLNFFLSFLFELIGLAYYADCFLDLAFENGTD